MKFEEERQAFCKALGVAEDLPLQDLFHAARSKVDRLVEERTRIASCLGTERAGDLAEDVKAAINRRDTQIRFLRKGTDVW